MARTRQDDKRGCYMRTQFIFTLIFYSHYLQAVSTLESEQLSNVCPQKFIGKVVDVVNRGAPLSSPMLEKVHVVFSVLKSERGEFRSQQEVDVLKFGPTRFEKDQVYDLELNQGYLCSAMKVE